jgi:CxxC motif-containing protein (DUF1111 family)
VAVVGVVGLVTAGGCADESTAHGDSSAPPALAPGGEATAVFRSATFLRPAPNLSAAKRPDFWAGKALAGQPWVRAPSITDARDGLGPLYDARTCFDCHVEGGRGRSPGPDGLLPVATVVRLGRAPSDERRAARPDATYGDQLQRQSISLAHQLRNVRTAEGPSPVPAEGRATVRWLESPFVYPDGARVSLRRPVVELSRLGYGPLEAETQVGLRHAPPLFGAGLLDRVPKAAILAAADPDDADGDGISGRPNRVWDPESKATRVGRFGWKAGAPSLRVQVAAALRNDVGITSSPYPDESCTAAQSGCRAAPSGRGDQGVEIADRLLDSMTGFSAGIAVPQRRKPEHPMVRRGHTVFTEVGCDRCHRPSFETEVDPGAPHLSKQTIQPYSDLLLHDLGEALASGPPHFTATEREWRTAPLWGVGLARAVREDAGFLHDGRARTVEEAILWHGGEAAPVRERFVQRTAAERAALIAFVKSL